MNRFYRGGGFIRQPVLLVLLATLATALLVGWLAQQALERQARGADLAKLATLRDVQADRLLAELGAQRDAVNALVTLLASSNVAPRDGRQLNEADPTAARWSSGDASPFSAVQPRMPALQPGWAAVGLSAGLSGILFIDSDTGMLEAASFTDDAQPDTPLPGDSSWRDSPAGRAFSASAQRAPAENPLQGTGPSAQTASLSAFGVSADRMEAAWFAAPLQWRDRSMVLLARTDLVRLQQTLAPGFARDGAKAPTSAAPSNGPAGTFVIRLESATDDAAGQVGMAGDDERGASREFARPISGPDGTAPAGDSTVSVELVAVRRVQFDAASLAVAATQRGAANALPFGEVAAPAGIGAGLIGLLLGGLAWRRKSPSSASGEQALVRMTAARDELLAKLSRETAMTGVESSTIAQAKVALTGIGNDLSALSERASAAVETARNVGDIGREAREEITTVVTAIKTTGRQAGEICEAASRADQSAKRASQSMRSTADAVRQARELIRQTEKNVKRLGERSQEISRVVGMIDTIGERTGILALNASLHAATAGDLGRQFAGLADEVKRLSKAAGQATGQIGHLVTAIQAETADGVAAVSGAIMQVVEISEHVGQADLAISAAHTDTALVVTELQRLAGAVAEQSETGARLRERLGQIEALDHPSRNAWESQLEETRRLAAVSIKLVTDLEQLRGGTHG